MTKHTLRSTQTVAADPDRVWRFFSNAANLGRITPRSMDFAIHTPEPSTEEGATIDYTVRPLFGIPARWQSLIEDVSAPNRFRDVQVKGPYKSWIHEHRFTEVDGGVRMDDRVDYEMPFGPFGALGHRMAVRAQLEYVFDFRSAAINDIFEAAGDPDGATPGTIAVAGGTGFVGGEIARELRRRGRHVIALSSRGEAARGQLPDDIEIRVADVREPESLEQALAGVDELVISLAFPGLPVEQPKKGFTFMEVDAHGTERLIAAGQRAGVGRVVYISGAGAGHDAERHWFRAKAVAEDAVRGSGMTWTILRPTWVYGPGDVSLNRFLGFARVLPFVPLTNFGNQQLAPVFVGDVAKLAADSLEDEAAAGQIFDVGGPETLSMREVLHRAMAITGTRKPLIPAPAAVVKMVAWPMRFLPNAPLSPDAVDFVNQPATVDVAPLLTAMPRVLTRLDVGLASYLGPQRSTVTIADGLEEEIGSAA
jgi:NADH dehydrogenase